MQKMLKHARIYLVFLVSFFSFVVYNQMIFATTDMSKVNVSITTDKDSYELTDKANITIIIENKNSYGIFVEELDLGLPDYILHQVSTEIPEKVEANSKSTIELKNINLGFQDFKNVDLDEQNIKVGILSSYNTISPDSIFSVNCISKGHDEFEKYLSNLDEKNNAQRVAFFDFAIRDKNSTPKELNGYAKIYIQIPDGWDAAELQAIFVSNSKDEEFEEVIETIDGVKYLTFKTNHFSPYALFDPNISVVPEPGPVVGNTSTNAETGDNTAMQVTILSLIILASFILYLVFRNKKRKIAMSLALIFLVGSNIYLGDTVSAESSSKKIVIKDFDVKGFKDFEISLSPDIKKCSSYADSKNWAFNNASKENTVADVFFVSPTMYTGADNMEITDATFRAQIESACKMQKPIYVGGELKVNSEDNTKVDYIDPVSDNVSRRFFAPYYRQIGFGAYLKSDRGESNLKIAYSDIKDAFQYYLDNYNKNPDDNNNMRPIILAGFSQGADMCIRLMKDFKDVLSDKLIACYAIGWRYTEEDEKACGIDHATDEDSVGKVICFNCESENIGKEDSTIKGSMMVPKNVKSYVINPLTWSTTNQDINSDGNYDGINDYKGSLIYANQLIPIIPTSDSTIIKNVAKIGAKINEDRGTLIIDHNEFFRVAHAISPDLLKYVLSCSQQMGGSNEYEIDEYEIDEYEKESNDNGYIFHIFDYQLFYNNLKENVETRTNAFINPYC